MKNTQFSFYKKKIVNKTMPVEMDIEFLTMVIETGDIETVRRALEDQKVDPSDDDNASIIVASEGGHLEIVELLLKWIGPNGERVDPGTRDNSPIRLAIENGELEMVKLLLKDSRVDPSDNDNYVIRFASRFGYLEIVKLLLNWVGPNGERVDPNDYDDADENSSIDHANMNNHLEIVSLLEDFIGNPDGGDNPEYPPEVIAENNKHTELKTCFLLDFPKLETVEVFDVFTQDNISLSEHLEENEGNFVCITFTDNKYLFHLGNPDMFKKLTYMVECKKTTGASAITIDQHVKDYSKWYTNLVGLFIDVTWLFLSQVLLMEKEIEKGKRIFLIDDNDSKKIPIASVDVIVYKNNIFRNYKNQAIDITGTNHCSEDEHSKPIYNKIYLANIEIKSNNTHPEIQKKISNSCVKNKN
jgi:hypothetical protein